MVRKIRDLKCPFCGGAEFVRGRAFSRAGLWIAPLRDKLFDFRENTQPEIRVYCKNCGSLVREYIRNPEYLEP